MMRIERLQVGQRFKQVFDFDETKPPIVITGTLIYKNSCRVLVQPDGKPQTALVTFGNGRTVSFHKRPKPQTWPLDVEVEAIA